MFWHSWFCWTSLRIEILPNPYIQSPWLTPFGILEWSPSPDGEDDNEDNHQCYLQQFQWAGIILLDNDIPAMKLGFLPRWPKENCVKKIRLTSLWGFFQWQRRRPGGSTLGLSTFPTPYHAWMWAYGLLRFWQLLEIFVSVTLTTGSIVLNCVRKVS